MSRAQPPLPPVPAESARGRAAAAGARAEGVGVGLAGGAHPAAIALAVALLLVARVRRVRHLVRHTQGRRLSTPAECSAQLRVLSYIADAYRGPLTDGVHAARKCAARQQGLAEACSTPLHCYQTCFYLNASALDPEHTALFATMIHHNRRYMACNTRNSLMIAISAAWWWGACLVVAGTLPSASAGGSRRRRR